MQRHIFILSCILALSACNFLTPVSQEDLPTAPLDAYQQDATPAPAAVSSAPDIRACDPLTDDIANTTKNYDSQTYGIHFTAPYHPKWGTTADPAPPFQELSGDAHGIVASIHFGRPVRLVEAPISCDYSRRLEMVIVPARTAQQAQKTFQNDNDPVAPMVTVQTVGSVQVLKYNLAGFCPSPTLEVVGTKYNYQFTIECTDEPGAWDELMNVVKTVVLSAK